MESDSKDGQGKSNVAPVEPPKEKVVYASKRRGRKNKKTVDEKDKTNEEGNKTKELPAILQPKFPSHKSSRKVPVKDDCEANQADYAICQEEDNGMSMEMEREKAENHWEEGILLVDEMQMKEEEMDQQREMQENAHASSSAQENKGKIETPPEKQLEKEKQEKKVEKKVEKASTRDKKSGRSEEWKKNKKDSVSSDEKKSAEDKKRGDPMLLRKKPSAEDVNSDELRKSGRKSKRMRKSNFKPVRPGQQQTQGPQSAYQPIQRPPKTDRSLKLGVDDNKLNDDKGKKGIGQHPKKEVAGQQQQKGPPVPAKSPLPGATVYIAPEFMKQQSLIQQPLATSQQVPLKKEEKKRKYGFLKNVYHKTKFWGRKDIPQPPDSTCKAYVKQDYDAGSQIDFMPDLHKILQQDEYKARESNNQCTKDQVFIDKRPFWLTRSTGESLPKVRIQLHLPLKQAFEGNPNSILPKLSRTEPFCDPRKDPLDKMKAIDSVIGVDLNFVSKDPINGPKEQRDQKDKELNRICANTFYATVMFEQQKLAADAKKKKSELEAKMETAKRGKREKPHKSSFEDGKETNSKKNVTFNVPQEPMLAVYNRKHRPRTFHPSIGTVGDTRKILMTKYKLVGKSGRDKKPRAPSPSGSACSPASSISNSAPLSSSSQSSSAEGKKN